MTDPSFTGLFVAEGTSDAPLAGIVESLFFERGVSLRLSKPDYAMLGARVKKDVESRIRAGVALIGSAPRVIVVHRDSDNVDPFERRVEVESAVRAASSGSHPVPVIPVKMTEAWLLLDEQAIRTVAGNPRGKLPLGLPKTHEVESRADPKAILADCILRASELTGRRRERLSKRFSDNRRQLLERLDHLGPVASLASWQALVDDVDEAVLELGGPDGPTRPSARR